MIFFLSFNFLYLIFFLRPSQLLEMRLAEAVSDEPENRTGPGRQQLLDLIVSCLAEDPAARITAAAARQRLAAMTASPLQPSRADNLLLPSPVLLFTLRTTSPASASPPKPAVHEELTFQKYTSKYEEASVEDQLGRIQELCAHHGRLVDTRVVVDTSADCCQFFVQFLSPQAAARTRILLTCPTTAKQVRTVAATNSDERSFMGNAIAMCSVDDRMTIDEMKCAAVKVENDRCSTREMELSSPLLYTGEDRLFTKSSPRDQSAPPRDQNCLCLEFPPSDQSRLCLESPPSDQSRLCLKSLPRDQNRLCLESAPRGQLEMKRGFLSEFYPLDLWYKSPD